MFVAVAIDLALDRLFTYTVPAEFAEKLLVGQLLRVSFGHRVVRGFAMSIKDSVESEKLVNGKKIVYKPIIGIEDESPFFSEKLLKLVKWIAGYTDSPIETTLKAALPAAVLKPTVHPRELLFVEVNEGELQNCRLTKYQQELVENIQRVGGGWMQQLIREFKTSSSTLRALAQKGILKIEERVLRRNPLSGCNVIPTQPLALNVEQANALKVILEECGVLDGKGTGTFKPILLHGVTGSGKTEIYLQAIANVLKCGGDAIVLVPEISLTPQTVRRFAGRFGSLVAVLHSALSDGERYDEWHRIRTGEARVVVGPRSAIFAPLRNLKLIVVDEEHDQSYKQDETPRYHARDIAVMRALYEGAVVVLGSATPSLESWYNALKGKYQLVSVPHRVAGRSMPTVNLVNMDEETARLGHPPIFSAPLLEAIKLRLERGEQSILFLNRRGYSRVLECPECAWVAECPNCSLPYTYHRVDNCLRCHVCGEWIKVPTECPNCHNTNFSFVGIGTQRAEDALKRCFQHARILRMDADSTSRKFSHDDILTAFRAGKADVLLGTQMIAKGLDFPNVTLVGVLNADTSLNRPDPRASERTYQLLAQVSGRAGRAEKPGEVYIQTFSPEVPAIAAVASNEGFDVFAEQELKDRKEAYFPPYCRMATLLFKAQDEKHVLQWAQFYAKSLQSWAKQFNINKDNEPFRVSDAEEASLLKAEGWYRYQVVLRAPTSKDIVTAVHWIEKERPIPKTVRLAFDVDAQNFS